jgi:hypothetical protein
LKKNGMNEMKEKRGRNVSHKKYEPRKIKERKG